MHREISHADRAFQQESRLGLYLLTGLLGLLLAADVWPLVANWIATWGPSLPSWSNKPYGYRLALLSARRRCNRPFAAAAVRRAFR